MEMNFDPPDSDPAAGRRRSSGARSWLLALALGATLTLAGVASVLAASPSADPSASPAATSSASPGTAGGHVCDRAASGTDSSGSSASG